MSSYVKALELGKNRIEALSDGVFAIVMTLLILEIHVPDLPHNAPNVQVFPALIHLWPKFFTYVVSFIGLGFYWIAHHNMYNAIRSSDRILLWLNILFFMFVSLLPFSTSFLNAFRQSQIAPIFFGANLTVIGWILLIQWTYASSRPGMITETVTKDYQKLVKARLLIIPIIASLVMLICFWSTEILLIVYAALLPFYMIPWKHKITAVGNS